MKHAIVFIALFLSICSCKKTSNGFNEKLIVDPMEATTGGLVLRSVTIRAMQCGQCQLITSVEKKGNNITVNISGISIPPGCNSTPASAFGQAMLDTLVNGNYSLTINNGGKQSTGGLTVTDDTYSLSFDQLNDIQLGHDKLRRLPANMIWGEVLCPDSLRAPVAEVFIDSLLYSGAMSFTLPDGHYTDFDIKNGDISIGAPYSNAYIKYSKEFIYKYTGNTRKLDTIVTSFGTREAPHQTIFIINTSKHDFYRYPPIPVY